jgi:hypothetical protein
MMTAPGPSKRNSTMTRTNTTDLVELERQLEELQRLKRDSTNIIALCEEMALAWADYVPIAEVVEPAQRMFERAEVILEKHRVNWSSRTSTMIHLSERHPQTGESRVRPSQIQADVYLMQRSLLRLLVEIKEACILARADAARARA